MFLVSLAALGIGFVFKKTAKSSMRAMPFLMSGFEAGMLGYALYILLFGSDNIEYFAKVDLGQVIFVFTVFLTLLKQKESGSFKESLKTMGKSPVILSITLGVLIGATGLGKIIDESMVGGIFQYIFDFISAPTAAVILFVVGYELEFRKLNFKSLLSVVLTRLIIMGVFCIVILMGVGAIIPINDYLKWAFVLMFMLPPPFVLPIFVENDDENAFISASLSVYTIVTLVIFAVIAYLIA